METYNAVGVEIESLPDWDGPGALYLTYYKKGKYVPFIPENNKITEQHPDKGQVKDGSGGYDLLVADSKDILLSVDYNRYSDAGKRRAGIEFANFGPCCISNYDEYENKFHLIDIITHFDSWVENKRKIIRKDFEEKLNNPKKRIKQFFT